MFQLQSITSADSKTIGANHVRTVENISTITAEIMESDVRQHVRNAGGHGERRHLVYAHAGPGGAGKSKPSQLILAAANSV